MAISVADVAFLAEWELHELGWCGVYCIAGEESPGCVRVAVSGLPPLGSPLPEELGRRLLHALPTWCRVSLCELGTIRAL